ncbi:hypothetical protein Hanom_Chr03g00193501 [Helianthus anomalus]
MLFQNAVLKTQNLFWKHIIYFENATPNTPLIRVGVIKIRIKQFGAQICKESNKEDKYAMAAYLPVAMFNHMTIRVAPPRCG